jgi:photosystem II stability/assembly factor-like uncharacterized protein
MKTFLLASFASILYILSFTFFSSPQNKKRSTEDVEIESALTEYYTDIRKYPYNEFPAEYYKNLVLSASQKYYKTNGNKGIVNINSWQLEGPKNIGGRLMAVAFNKQNLNTIMVGCAAGGIFKTKNGGQNWYPVFDNNAFLSISSITYDPNDSNIVYAGTGDKAQTVFSYFGNGIYKSTDGGDTWSSFGFSQAAIIEKIIIHPSNSAIMYASINEGGIYQKGSVYKTINSGQTWNKIFPSDTNKSTNDLEIAPSNPNIIYTSIFGDTSKVYKSIDGGNTWTSVFNAVTQGGGLYARLGITVSHQNANKVYLSSVSYASATGERLFATTTGGTLWAQKIAGGANNVFGNFAPSFEQIAINPFNDNHVLLTGIRLHESLNGGNTFSVLNSNYYVDVRAIQFIDSVHCLVATDGGLFKIDMNLSLSTKIDDIPNTQFYRVNHNIHNPNDYYGGAQDQGTLSGNINTVSNWQKLLSGDGFTVQFPKNNQNYFYAEFQFGKMQHINAALANTQITNGINSSEDRNWDFPYFISRYNDSVMYCGTTGVYQGDATSPQSVYWTSISPVLSNGQWGISSIDEGLSPGKLLAGTTDGKMWRLDAGASTWDDISDTNIDRVITCVKFSPNIQTNMYVARSGYQRTLTKTPYLHKSINDGLTWINISGNLPNFGINDVYIWAGNENLIFIANDIGVYYTIDGGTIWNRLGNNMLFIPVFDIDFNPGTNRLFVGTFARGMQSIDISNITGLSKVIQNDYSISLFPNPAIGILNIRTDISKIEKKSIYNLKGQLILEDFTSSKQLNVSSLQKGYYLLVLNSNGSKVVKKFVKE